MSKSEVRPESDDEWLVELLSSHAGSSSRAAEAAESSMDVEGDTLQQLLTSDGSGSHDGWDEPSLSSLLAKHSEFCKGGPCVATAASRCENPVSFSGAFVMVDGRREQLVSANYYKTLIPVALQNLPRLQSVMRTVLADPQIHVDFLTCQLASKILEHAYTRIRHLISTSVKFKIGQTADPSHRWRRAAHSYLLEKPRVFRSMKLLAIFEHGEAAAMLEAALIATFISHEACLNVVLGGESISKIDGYASPTPGPPRRSAVFVAQDNSDDEKEDDGKKAKAEVPAVKKAKTADDHTQPKPKETDDKKQPKPKETDDKKQTKPKETDETDDKKQTKPEETDDKKQAKPEETDDKKQAKPEETDDKKQADVTWNNLHEKAVCDGEFSSEPFVTDDEVYVSFESGLEWRVPHLVPDDLKGGQKALPMVGKAQQPKRKPKPKASPKPVPDFDLGCCRIKYCTQGTKMPILKFEVRADRTGPCSLFKQKMQVVVKEGGFTAEQGMNFLKSFAFAYDGMNMNPDEIDFRVCKQSLLDYGSKNGVDWSKHLSWKFINKLKLPGFPEASIGLI
ncbi:cpt [Symbiodinium sp. CCMP2592]|nr:cpt [Symbiodinium sp. CCMP2592]